MHFTWAGWLLHAEEKELHIYHGLLVFFILLVCSLVYRFSLKSTQEELVPDSDVGLKNIFQAVVESIMNLIRGIIPHHPETYFPLIGAVFIYIFTGNMIALFPGILPPTENINTNLAVALTVFVYFNIMGMKSQGVKKYIAHFMGPIWWLAPLIFCVEVLGIFLRPASLSLRLFGNINGDHLVLQTFTSLVPIAVPIIFLAFGIFVSFIQAFVFSLLSTIYIGLAVETHEHEAH